MPLEAERETPVVALDRLDHAVGGLSGDAQPSPEAADRLMVLAVDLRRSAREAANQPGALSAHKVWRAVVGELGQAVGVHVLVEAAARAM